MSRHQSGLTTLFLIAITAISSIAYIASINTVPVVYAAASYTAAAKPMEFYLHYLDVPVDVAGLQTKYVMNTTQLFRFQTQQDAYANSFFKAADQPKVAIDFYLYPNFAGPVTLDGLWQVFVWLNGSAYKSINFKLEFREVTVGGGTLWDSGLVTPAVSSSIGEYMDVPIYNYNLSKSLTHAFSPNTSLLVHTEINTGTAVSARIWYDSPFYPAKVILPAKDYARPFEVKTYAWDNSETDLFYYNWSDSQRKVIVRANVTDPFGGYDIYRVNMTLLDPAGSPVISDLDMARKSDGQWLTQYSHVFEANWSYPSTAQLGNYTVRVSVLDNNGFYRGLPFIEHNDHVFMIGIIVYYDPAFLVVDDVDAPLPGAQVFITWPNGSRDVLPRYTGANGYLNLTHALPADYGFTILWKDVVVRQVTVTVDSDGPYVIKTDVYQLAVLVLGNNAVPVHGAYVIVYTQAGVGYGLDTTDASGTAVFKLPRGTYNVEAYFSAEYWLRVVRTSAAEPGVVVNSSTSKTVVLADFPPAIWTTAGFWLLIALVAVSVFAAVYIVFLSRKRIPALSRRKKK